MSPVPADDGVLRLAVTFCNTRDALADPPDYLTIDVARKLLKRYDQTRRGRLRDSDLPALRDVRDRLYRVFAAETVPAKAKALNALLRAEAAQAQITTGPAGDLRLGATGGDGPVGKFTVGLADALARVLADGAAERLRTCVADPCRCVYVDRTRPGRQRYCCELCNDRVASAAYRRRKSS
jgi:predicted RNA-binding Zn ribbon-like protein